MKRNIIYLFILFVLYGCVPPAEVAPTVPEGNPEVAVLSAPAKNKTCEEGTGTSLTANTSDVTFTWGASKNAEFYDLIITDLNSNISSTFDKNTTTTKKVTLKRGVPYSWKVEAKSSKTIVTAMSEVWNFYLAGSGISNYAPFPATIVAPKTVLVSPKNGKVTLSWTGADPENDALTYTVFCDKVDGKQDPPAAQKNITGTSFDVAVEAGQVYYWRIKSADLLNSSYTIVYQFKVQ